MEIKITTQNFQKEVTESNVPVLVDFWADWCGPCKMVAPVIEEIAKKNEGKIKVGKVNVDEEMELAVRYQIAGIPTLVLFSNGNPVKTMVGYHSEKEIQNMIDTNA